MPLSILLQFFPKPIVFRLENSLTDAPRYFAGLESSTPSCDAWSACGDILLDQKKKSCLGFSYSVVSNSKLAREFASLVPDDAVGYVKRGSSYAVSIYGREDYDRLEIKWTQENIGAYIQTLSVDGFWYREKNNPANILAFGVSDLNELLEEHSLRLGLLKA